MVWFDSEIISKIQYLNQLNSFFIYRYLTWFEAFMTNLELSHPGAMELIDCGVLAVARSLIPGSLSAVDKTMEETFMKFAKSSGKSD